MDQATPLSLAIADCLIIGFFFLLRPGEHTYNTTNNHPFRLQDVLFLTPMGTHNAAMAPLPTLDTASETNLVFTTQKNGKQGEVITHGDTTDSLLSPVQALLHHIHHLCNSSMPPDMPLFCVRTASADTRVTSTHLTTLLHQSCAHLGTAIGLHPKGTMALL